MQFEQLGPYRLGKKLGQGGMGTVYEGVDAETGEAAAIKVLAPSLAVEEGFRVRFEAEIESLKKLRHPNIVRLHGYGEQAGTLFYAMELVKGTSLEDELRAGRRFEWREVTQIGIKLCRALKHAHDHGVIHRDLKPANLLLSSDGQIKLSDFGIARLFGNTRLTSDGGVLGTAEYMAPEQADGRSVTDRCDQYSLGGVLYALLAGRPPFRAKSLVEMLQLQRYAEPEPVTRFAPQTPAELARIVHQLLEKEPNRRYANTLILARSLEAMERGLSVLSSGDDDFVLGPGEESGSSDSGYRPLAPTLSPVEPSDVFDSVSTGSSGLRATEATMAYAPPPEKQLESAASTAAEPSDTAAGRFTKVSEKAEQTAAGIRESLAGLLSPQTVALVVALLILVLGGWYLMQPPSADHLYAQIDAAAADGDVESLQGVRSTIERFLAQYPDDARAERVRALDDEAKLASPVQRAFAEAKRYTFINPELSAQKFQALIDVYDDQEKQPDGVRRFVKLSRQELTKLENRLARQVVDDRKLVASRLARATELAAENPAAARKIYQGIVSLYGDKVWAAQLVAQARSGLATIEAPQAAAEAPRGE